MTTRQTKSANALIEEKPDIQVIAKIETMQRGYVDKWHKHPWHQIIFPFEGILQTRVANSQYVVPHTGILFIPAHTYHESFVMTQTKFIGIYLNPKISIDYPQKTKAVSATALMKELILHINDSMPVMKALDKNVTKLLDVLVNQLINADTYDMTLLLPSDRRLMLIFKTLMGNLQLETTLSQWAKQVGASERTLSRLFTKELGMSFPLWRQRLRIVSSLSLLEDNLSIQEVAFKVGYSSDSSYIYAFKKFIKQTPQQYRNNDYKLSCRIKPEEQHTT